MGMGSESCPYSMGRIDGCISIAAVIAQVRKMRLSIAAAWPWTRAVKGKMRGKMELEPAAFANTPYSGSGAPADCV